MRIDSNVLCQLQQFVPAKSQLRAFLNVSVKKKKLTPLDSDGALVGFHPYLLVVEFNGTQLLDNCLEVERSKQLKS